MFYLKRLDGEYAKDDNEISSEEVFINEYVKKFDHVIWNDRHLNVQGEPAAHVVH